MYWRILKFGPVAVLTSSLLAVSMSSAAPTQLNAEVNAEVNAGKVSGHIPDRVAGEILVKFKNPSSQALQRLLGGNGTEDLQVVRRLSGSLSNLVVLKSRSENLTDSGSDSLMNQLASDPEVEFAQPNYIVRSQASEGRHVQGLSAACLLHPFDSRYCPQILSAKFGMVDGLKPTKPILKDRPQDVNPPVNDPGLKEIYSML